MNNSINIKINDAISRIDKTIEKHSFLFDLLNSNEIPHINNIESSSVFLQSFYNGIENIALLVLKNKKKDIPNNFQWHTNLLNSAFEQTENGTSLFNLKYKNDLDIYKSFRHKFRHIYMGKK